MSNFYLTFDTETSRVLSYQSSVLDEESLREMVQVNNPTWDISPVEEADAPTAYMIQIDGVWEQRQKTALAASWSADSVTANGTAEIVLSQLPIPCTVYLDGDVVVVEDGSLEFSTEAVGFYKVMVDEPAYLQKEWVINAV
jgi:hypothetical protein